jgi:hypothetical protein
LVVFVDRSLGKHDVPDVLKSAGAVVAVHSDYFADNAPDVYWLKIVGHQGWAVLTKDHAIRKRLIERKAIVDGNVKAFFLVPRKLTGVKNGEILARAIPRIGKLCTGNPLRS